MVDDDMDFTTPPEPSYEDMPLPLLRHWSKNCPDKRKVTEFEHVNETDEPLINCERCSKQLENSRKK